MFWTFEMRLVQVMMSLRAIEQEGIPGRIPSACMGQLIGVT